MKGKMGRRKAPARGFRHLAYSSLQAAVLPVASAKQVELGGLLIHPAEARRRKSGGAPWTTAQQDAAYNTQPGRSAPAGSSRHGKTIRNIRDFRRNSGTCSKRRCGQ